MRSTGRIVTLGIVLVLAAVSAGAAAEKIGGETTNYVRNIFKYYVAYKLTLEHAELQRKLKEQIQKGG